MNEQELRDQLAAAQAELQSCSKALSLTCGSGFKSPEEVAKIEAQLEACETTAHACLNAQLKAESQIDILRSALTASEKSRLEMRALLLQISDLFYPDDASKVSPLWLREAFIGILHRCGLQNGSIKGVQTVSKDEGECEKSEQGSGMAGITTSSESEVQGGPSGARAKAMPFIQKENRPTVSQESGEGQGPTSVEVCGVHRENSETKEVPGMRLQGENDPRTPQGLQQAPGGSMAVLDLSRARAQDLIHLICSTPPTGYVKVEELQSHLEQALSCLCDAGNNSRHDPSWIRPMTLTRQQLNEACQQAYHHIHKAIETLKEGK